MNSQELKAILDRHAKWARREDGGERADLRSADLSSADLSSANLSFADLSFANLRSADLRSANLSFADLRFADLSSANLSFADLSFADLSFADLRFAKEIESCQFDYSTTGMCLACPEEGTFVGWKKCAGGVIAKLQIPAKAKRSSATTRKCRASEVKTLWLSNGEKSVKSMRDDTKYVVGKTTKADTWDETRWNECSNGIHFFLTRIEAERWGR